MVPWSWKLVKTLLCTIWNFSYCFVFLLTIVCLLSHSLLWCLQLFSPPQLDQAQCAVISVCHLRAGMNVLWRAAVDFRFVKLEEEEAEGQLRALVCLGLWKASPRLNMGQKRGRTPRSARSWGLLLIDLTHAGPGQICHNHPGSEGHSKKHPCRLCIIQSRPRKSIAGLSLSNKPLQSVCTNG